MEWVKSEEMKMKKNEGGSEETKLKNEGYSLKGLIKTLFFLK